ncbi:MAG TPA: phosphoribosylaminoimidazolesuccinocarboxamide synthase [Bryobacteraceae bacterium]|nr:phosphoribosylaminoimidazolesuccinocarboxamide synthase [Bryobacteraceae bacterium]
MSQVLTTTHLPGIEKVGSGKVRDVYRVGDDLLIIATDRISAFDCILPQGIPGKGRILTQMSLFWFDFLRGTVPNHLITASVGSYPSVLHPFRDQLEGRSMLVRRCRMEPIECVARGYVSGSGWKDYKRTGAICGIPLPPGLRESDKLPEPIFTPATKAETGHDENISFDEAARIIGRQTAALLRDLTLNIYTKASEWALQCGIILADTKFEFGWSLTGENAGQLLLGDEVLTPDSSRFWPADEYAPGGPQKSFDKQFVRDYLETLAWNKQPPAPDLPAEVIEKTASKYHDAYRRLTGRSL